MRINKSFLSIAFFIAAFLMTINGAFAQAPSLAASDQFVVAVKTDDGEETFTIIRDGRIEEQFYYVPAKPTIATQVVGGKKTPVFQLLSYQTKDENDKLKQGGILQMSVVMGVPQATVDKIKAEVKKEIKLSVATKTHLLSPMPIKSSEITLYDMGGDMLDQAPPKGGIAPIFGNQHFPFMLRLKDLGTDVMEALCRNKGGLPVLVTYTFQGMTPKGGFNVEVNWDACYKHFSSQTTVGIDAAQCGLSGGFGLDYAKIREEFEANGLIKITSLSNAEAITAERLDELMSPVLNLITKELFEQIHAPTSVDAASAKEIAERDKKSAIGKTVSELTKAYKAFNGALSASAKVNVALKDVKIVKKGTFTYKFDRQAIVERTTSFGGLLGIGNYPKAIQDSCITTMPTGRWESAYFVLPAVGDPDELGINTVDISVIPEEKNASGKWIQIEGHKIVSAGFNKAKNQQWTNRDRKEVTRFLFPLKALYAKKNFKHENYRFKIDTIIQPKTGKSIELTSYSPMFDGDLPMAPPSDLVDVLTIDGSCLTYGEEPDQVFKAVGQLKAGKTAWGIKLDEANPMQTFLVPVAEKEIKATSLNFVHRKGRLGAWNQKGKNLRDLDSSLWFMIFDGEWNDKVDIEKLPAEALIKSPL